MQFLKGRLPLESGSYTERFEISFVFLVKCGELSNFDCLSPLSLWLLNLLFTACFCSSEPKYFILFSPKILQPASQLYERVFVCSASGCPHANKNRTRSLESSLAMGGSLLKYGPLIKPTIHSVPYQPPPPGQKLPVSGINRYMILNHILGSKYVEKLILTKLIKIARTLSENNVVYCAMDWLDLFHLSFP